MLRLTALCLLVASAAHASEPQEQRAASLFSDGKRAFDEERYAAAYDAFHAAYALTAAPALLYDMSAAQEALGRPGEAATSLRAYLRVVKEEPNRGAIEARIRALDEAQRMIEVEQLRAQRPRLLELRAVEARSKRNGLAIGLGVGGAVIAVGLGIGLGIGLGLHPSYPSSTLGTQRVTP